MGRSVTTRDSKFAESQFIRKALAMVVLSISGLSPQWVAPRRDFPPQNGLSPCLPRCEKAVRARTKI
jgi:hypothetical protein